MQLKFKLLRFSLLLILSLILIAPAFVRADDANLGALSSFNGWGDVGNVYTFQTHWQGQTALKTVYNPNYGVGSRGENEVDGQWIPVSPGDHIYFTALVWTSASSLGDTDLFDGGRIGIDMYGNGRICEIDMTDGRQGNDAMWNGDPTFYALSVPWGSGQWVRCTMNFIVPASYVADGNGPNAAYSAGTVVTPSGFIPWMSGPDSYIYKQTGKIEKGAVYYADTQIYVNPDSALSLPTPAPTADPTSSPQGVGESGYYGSVIFFVLIVVAGVVVFIFAGKKHKIASWRAL
jgi:hypothetical protein